MHERSLSEEQAAAFAASLIAGQHFTLEKALSRVRATYGIRPTMLSVESELRRWFHTFEKDAHAKRLQKKREIALEVLDYFSEWKPFLIGSVLSGAALEDSPIEIFIRTNEEKALELFLLSREIDYEIEKADGSPISDGFTFILGYGDETVLLYVSDKPCSLKKQKRDLWQSRIEANARASARELRELLSERQAEKD